MMNKAIILLIVLIQSTIVLSQEKRGIAYGYHSPEDMEVLAPQVSWWYNWSEKPENSVANVFEDYGFEFVPMTWNGYFDSVKLVTFLADHPETKYLLAFNEPNFINQANMTPSQAAAIWPICTGAAMALTLKKMKHSDCMNKPAIWDTKPDANMPRVSAPKRVR